MPDPPAGLALEPAAFVAGLAEALHRAGVPVGPERAGRLARGLRLQDPTDRGGLYWTARVTLVSQHEQVAVFDAVFAAVFDGVLDPADNRGDTAGPPPIGAEPRPPRTSPDGRPLRADGPTPDGVPRLGGPDDSGDPGDAPERDTVLAAASHSERLMHTSFADLSADEVARTRQLVRRIVLATPQRRTRRTRPTGRPGEQVDVRRTIKVSRRTGGDPVRLMHRRRRRRPRRLVLLCDVSGSMEPYTRVYLTLLQGAVSGAGAEAFVFSTQLTRLTRQLAVRDPDQALARAAGTAEDWASGTRLAGCLRQFLDGHGRRGLARGAVVVVLSDGWAAEDPASVERQMARLGRLAHRVVWVNPRKAAPGYAPLVGGMAAALPYCDEFVSGHNLAALQELANAVRASR